MLISRWEIGYLKSVFETLACLEHLSDFVLNFIVLNPHKMAWECKSVLNSSDLYTWKRNIVLFLVEEERKDERERQMNETKQQRSKQTDVQRNN